MSSFRQRRTHATGAARPRIAEVEPFRALISGTTITKITGNGHTVTYDEGNAANSALGGKTYTLSGGGTLTPAS